MNPETTLEEKQQALQARLRSLESVIVAYSGGVDSAYLAYAAHAVLGPQMLAVIADSASLARSQYADAQDFAHHHGIPLRSIETHELEREQYAVNGPDRCFHCKDELFTVLEQELERTGFRALAYGLNLDDGQDFRPGHKAAAQHRVTAPLSEARLTKADVRALAQRAQLRVWDKPASACLSSRMEYGRRVTPESLRMIEQAQEIPRPPSRLHRAHRNCRRRDGCDPANRENEGDGRGRSRRRVPVCVFGLRRIPFRVNERSVARRGADRLRGTWGQLRQA
jgi:pyridinium-3,5-biscarboxylic acid mononucleotide sulfurtransferase